VSNADGSREGLVTGYYEPLIKGSRSRSKAYAWPVLGVPDDLLNLDISEVYPELKGQRVRGRLVGNKVLPYYSRADIDRLKERFAGKTLLYAEDAVELFFLQVQGSGRVQLPDGSIVRLAYADTNGHPYQSIGRWLADKGELRVEQASMEGIKNWARANPGRLQEMLNANPSYIFFREAPAGNGGPVGALGQPLTEGAAWRWTRAAFRWGAGVSGDDPSAQHPAAAAPDAGPGHRQRDQGRRAGRLLLGLRRRGRRAGRRMRQKGEMWVLWPRDQVPR
jgi:membrane-bound lytic murein transglycosylase A